MSLWQKVKSKKRLIWSVLWILMLFDLLVDGTAKRNWPIFSQITLSMIVQNLLILTGEILLYLMLKKYFPVLQWSLFSLLGKNDTATEEKSTKNANFAPLEFKFLAPFFLVLLIVNIPYLARLEEEIFRLGTDNWYEGLLRSLLFGFVHCLVGVPLSAGLILTLSGLWLTYYYFNGGIELSSAYHASFNLNIVVLGCLCWVLSKVIKTKTQN